MSHYVMGVVLKKGESLESIMAPYDEDLTVDEYETECWCINWEATLAAQKPALLDLGFSDREELRADFRTKNQDVSEDVKNTNWKSLMDKMDSIKESYIKNHELYNKPTPDCESCNGTGHFMTEKNPEGKWDWYQVGGRWDIRSYLERAKEEYPDNQNLKSFIENNDLDNTMTIDEAHELMILIKSIYDNSFFYGLLLPIDDIHRWFARGEMGWFGVSHDEDVEFDALQVFDRHKFLYDEDYELIIVDCHI